LPGNKKRKKYTILLSAQKKTKNKTTKKNKDAKICSISEYNMLLLLYSKVQ
jgi:hypothetical protein